MHRPRLVLLSLLTVTFAKMCLAERIVEPAFTNYSTIDGLSLNKINYISKRDSGELFLATDYLINTFDGSDFGVVAASHQWATAIERIYELSRNEFALVNESGELRGFDVRNDRLIDFSADKREFQDLRFSLISFNQNKQLFLLDSKSRLYKLEQQKLSKVAQLDDINVDSFSCSLTECWFSSDSGIHLLTLDSLVLTKQPEIYSAKNQEFPKENSNANSINYIQHSGSKLFLVLKGGAVYSKMGDEEWVTTGTLPHCIKINTLLLDDKDELWIGTAENGLFWRPKSSKEFFSLKHSQSDRYSIPNDSILDIKQDRFGVVWLATDKGLAKLDIPRMQMGHIRYNQSKFGLVDRDFSEIFELLDKRLVIGNRSSLTFYSKDGPKEKEIQLSSKADNEKNKSSNDTSSFCTNRSSSFNNTYAIEQLDSKWMWLGTREGLLKFNLESYQTEPLATKHPLLEKTTYSLKSINEDTLIVGTRSYGAYAYNTRTSIVTPIAKEQAIKEVNSIYRDNSGITWILHTNGVLKLQGQGSVFNPIEVKSLAELDVTSMSQINPNEYWIGTKGKGLYTLNTIKNTVSKYSTEGFTRNPYINGILKSGEDHWVSLDNSLVKIDKNKNSTMYSELDGIQDLEFNLAMEHKSAQGLLYFGGSRGINAFTPNLLAENYYDAVVDVSVKLNNSDELLEKVELPKEIHESELPIRVDAKSIQTVQTKKNRIRYRFSGFGENWEVSNNSRIQLPINYLQAGDYSLIVQAKGYRTDWSTEEFTWNFTVIPYWWKSSWAYTLYSIALLLLLYALYSLRLNQLKRKAESLELIVQERTDEVLSQKLVIEKQYQKLDSLAKSKEIFFENLSHEFKTPLTLVLGPIKKLSFKYGSSGDSKMFQVVEKNANKVLNMVEQLLTISRLRSGLSNISRTNIKFSDFIRSKISEFQFLVEQKNITLYIDELNDNNVLIDRDSLDKILNNLLSNAIKYNVQGGFIKIQYKEMQNKIQVDITNSVTPAEQIIPDNIFNRFYREDTIERGSGIGLSFTRELIEQNGGEIAVNQSKATEISFQLLLELSSGVEEHVKQAQSKAENVDNNQIKILLIEDDEDMRFYIKQELSEYTVETASDGVEGVALAKKSIPDIIISDIMMPRLDGYGVIEELSNHQLTSHIPLILLTAKSSAASKIRGFKAGALEYLKKPFDANELRLRIANILRLQAQSVKSYRGLLQPNNARSEMTIDRDSDFVQQCFEHLETNYSIPEFDGKSFAKMENMSERQFQRKSKALFELSPSALIKEFRLKKAAEELLMGHGITTVCFSCGFIDTAHFSRVFKQKHSLSPTEYKKLNLK
jgi:signal transduction histidine kinase/DNA-binding response OmpR family regulator/ligand-binding sensor domain-containing protein